MRSIIVKVQIQFDQFGKDDSENYTAETLNKMNTVLQREFPDICPGIFANNIDSSDIEVSEEEFEDESKE